MRQKARLTFKQCTFETQISLNTFQRLFFDGQERNEDWRLDSREMLEEKETLKATPWLIN